MGVKRDRPVEKVVRPFQAFADESSSGGILLIAATVVALTWANSPWGETYSELWQTKLTIGLEGFSLTKDLTHWINDGLMAVFFLLVGLEIKRGIDRKSTRLNSSHAKISYAVFCLKKKKIN